MGITCSQDMFLTASLAHDHITGASWDSIGSYLLSQVNADGGFRGRSGESDLYYSLFGLGALLATGVGFSSRKANAYLTSFASGDSLDFVHLICLIRCRCIIRALLRAPFGPRLLASRMKGAGMALSTFLGGKGGSQAGDPAILRSVEEYRSRDGGYSHTMKNAEQGTIYAAFLAYLAYTDAGRKVPNETGLITSVSRLKLDDGSFANAPDVESGSTTSTAAALVLQAEITSRPNSDSCDQLFSRISPSGGFLGSGRAPGSDLLSTATALYALKRAGRGLGEQIEATRNFVEGLWNGDGGFSGSAWDDRSDCEYTFYALLALGCL